MTSPAEHHTSPAINADLSELLPLLRRSNGLEDAAWHLLSTLVGVCTTTVNELGIEGQVERGLLHLRPGEGYKSLLLLENGSSSVVSPGEDSSFLSSATAWQQVRLHARPVAIDERLGTLTVLGVETESTSTALDDTQTLRSIRRRRTTHMLVLPLTAISGEITGQVSIEVHAPHSIGEFPVWPAVLERLRALIDLASPYLLHLPNRERHIPTQDDLLPVIGPTMAPIIRNLQIFARCEETILLRGETGTGKSRLAKWCHAVSPRRHGPFEILDLNTIPYDLQQAELFGWRRGAFTGASQHHDGAVLRAKEGTLFIDEIDKLDLRTQASLLRLLEDGRYRILGDKIDRNANIRCIIGSNVDLEAAIAEGRFLRDLYYRINVLPICLPPLSERRDELLDWARLMLSRRAADTNLGLTGLEDQTLEPLLGCHWPGNLRQLDNTMRRAYALARADHDAPGPLSLTRNHIEHALQLDHPVDVGVGTSAMRQLERATSALVRAGFETDSQLDLDLLTGAFRGLALLEAVEQYPDLTAAFEALAKSNLVKSRNHQRTLRHARAQIAALRELLRKSDDCS